MRLHTDFDDYYDHYFSGKGELFTRISKNEMSRQEMFAFLQKHGFKTPKYGQVLSLYNPLNPYKKVVVYQDELIHQGEKTLTSMIQAVKYAPTNFATVYMGEQPSISYRHLQIGKQVFKLVYHSLTDPWRSTAGQIEVEIIDHSFSSPHPSIDHPLFAIDFVREGENYYAINFTTTPKLEGTGIEKVLLPSEVVSELSEPLGKANGW